MKKKLLIFMLVFGLTATANAVIVTFDSPSGPACVHGQPAPSIDVLPGAVVVVEVTADTVCTSTYFLSITESTTSAAGDATASIGTLHAGFTVNPQVGNLRNAGTNFGGGAPRHMLIDRISGGMNAPATIAAGQVLYQFELLIPANAVFCDTFTIDAALGFPVISPPPGGYSHTFDGVLSVPTNALTIHVVPEPMTMLLLGLGGLFLRRRK